MRRKEPITMDNQKYILSTVCDSEILALWLYYHPNYVIKSGESEFVYDMDLNCFHFRKPSNRVRNQWQRARGMDAWLSSAIRKNIELL